jgi:dTDP-4-amino-4,6-dideoxygalactose transaminase
VYYPRPLHRQTAYRDFPVAEGGCPVAERAATEVLSLPMHPYLDATTQERIAAACATQTVTTP